MSHDVSEGRIQWVSDDEEAAFPIEGTNPRKLADKYDLCVAGDGLKTLCQLGVLGAHLPYLRVYARVDPAQKVQLTL